MQPTDFIWSNGTLVPWDEAKIHVLTHSLHYGGGAFEGIRFYQTPRGPAILCLEEHVDRLLYSARALRMPLRYNKDEIIAAIYALVKANRLEAGYIRPLIFNGYGKMGVNPTGAPVDIIIACWAWGAYHTNNFLDIKTSRYIRVHPDSTIVDAKLCGHYINSILALLEIQGTHYHEVLLLDNKGYIAEGSAVNFFMVKDQTIYTPKLGTILAGITRALVIELAKSAGFSMLESDITLKDAYAADEAFFTGTAAEVTPIRSIDDNIIGAGTVGSVTLQLQQAFQCLTRGENPAYLSKLAPVYESMATVSE